MEDIDALLGQIRQLPLDPRLSTIDAAVMDGLGRAQGPALSGGVLAGVALFSLGTGLAGTLVPASASALPVSPLTAPGPLAPSTLLGTANE